MDFKMQTTDFANIQNSEELFVRLAFDLFMAASQSIEKKAQYEKIIAPAFARFNRIVRQQKDDGNARENWFFSNLAALAFDVSNLTKKKTRTMYDDVNTLVWEGVRTAQSKYELRF
jgi:hypothetical protein